MEQPVYTLKNGIPVPVSQATPEVRVTFMRKVYATFLGGVLVYALGAWLGVVNEGFRQVAFALIQLHWIAYLGLIIGAVFLVSKLSTIPRVNLAAFAGFAFLFGILCSPLIIFAAMQTGSFLVVKQAGVMTLLLFGGLSVFAFTTRRDFTVFGSILATFLIALFAVTVGGVIFGFGGSAWLSFAWVLLISAYVVYDTQMIQRRYGEEMYVAAAIALFIDFIILFQRILMILSRRR